MREQRRSRRFPRRLDVELATGKGQSRAQTLDVSRRGVFVLLDKPPPERQLMQLTLHAPTGRIDTTAWVSRRVLEPEDRRGAAFEFFALSQDAKSRWEAFMHDLSAYAATDASYSPAHGADSFIVKLHDKERLRDFVVTSVEAGAAFLVTPVLKPIGAPVSLCVLHPDTDEEFVLEGQVGRLHTERPKGIEIVFPEDGRGVVVDAFKDFVSSGHAPDHPLPVVTGVLTEHGSAKESGDWDRHDFEGPTFEIDLDELELSPEDTFEWGQVTAGSTIDLDLGDALVMFEDMSSKNGDPFELDNPDWQAREAPVTPSMLPRDARSDYGLHRSVNLHVQCSHCDVHADLVVGPLPGRLGWVAEARPVWRASSKSLLATRVLKSAHARQNTFDALDDEARHAQVPGAFIFEVADLPAGLDASARPPAVRALEALLSQYDDLDGVLTGEVSPCPACERGRWTVRLKARRPRSKRERP